MLSFETLEDRGALVTGGAGGIGLALARALVASGARVFLSDLDARRLEEVSSSMELASAPCDVTDPSSVASVVARAWDEIGPVDLLCANAGFVRPGMLLEVEHRDAQWQFDVNVWGVLNACRPFARRLREQRRPGHILVTGSEASLSHSQATRSMQVGIYHMTKHAVFSMADALRDELSGDGIGVSVLCPGPTSTELSQHSANSHAQRAGESPGGQALEGGLEIEMGEVVAERLKTPDEVAEIALAGLRRGLFVIPTHAHIREDVDSRYREIARGLEGL